MDDCANCEFLEKCRDGEKMLCPWETVESVYNPNIEEFLGGLKK